MEASDLEETTKTSDSGTFEAGWAILKSVAGIIVPGGFGVRGVEGKIAAAKYPNQPEHTTLPGFYPEPDMP